MNRDAEVEALYRSPIFGGDRLRALRVAFVLDRADALSRLDSHSVEFCDHRIAIIDKVLKERHELPAV